MKRLKFKWAEFNSNWKTYRMDLSLINQGIEDLYDMVKSNQSNE